MSCKNASVRCSISVAIMSNTSLCSMRLSGCSPISIEGSSFASGPTIFRKLISPALVSRLETIWDAVILEIKTDIDLLHSKRRQGEWMAIIKRSDCLKAKQNVKFRQGFFRVIDNLLLTCILILVVHIVFLFRRFSVVASYCEGMMAKGLLF